MMVQFGHNRWPKIVVAALAVVLAPVVAADVIVALI